MMKNKTRIESPNITRPDDPARHFTVPEGYFDTLASELLIRMDAEERAEAALRPRESSTRPRRRRALGMVAAVVAILLAVPLIYSYTPLSTYVEQTLLSDRSTSSYTEEMSDQDYEEYLMEDWADDYYTRAIYSAQ